MKKKTKQLIKVIVVATLAVGNITFNEVRIYKHNKKNEQVADRIVTIEGAFKEMDAVDQDLITTVLGTYQALVDTVEVYDNNVEIYNNQIKDLQYKVDSIIKYLK